MPSALLKAIVVLYLSKCVFSRCIAYQKWVPLPLTQGGCVPMFVANPGVASEVCAGAFADIVCLRSAGPETS